MRKFVLTLAVAAAAVALSACDSIDLTKQDQATGAEAPAEVPAAAGTEAPAAAGTSAAPANAATVVGVKVRDDATLGKVVTDWKGWTLYRFEKDTPKPSKSNCEADCLAKWPYVPYVENMKIDGVEQKLIGKVTRADGALQLTINSWPAYRYTGDAKIGETKGQGVGGVWFAFTPEGKKAQAVAADSGNGGY
jgi:predicted lipoprotein with Yx(FWY)xxD motif